MPRFPRFGRRKPDQADEPLDDAPDLNSSDDEMGAAIPDEAYDDRYDDRYYANTGDTSATAPDEHLDAGDYDPAVPYAEREYAPFVPVERAQQPYEDEESGYDDAPAGTSRRRMRLPRVRLSAPRVPRPRLGVEIRWTVLLVVALLIAGGVFGTLLNLGRLRDDVEAWWPLALLAGSVVWMIAALTRRNVTSFLGATGLAGVGVSALLDTQAIAAFGDTLFGVVLVTLGLGIIIRGFLLRTQVSL